MTNYRPARSLAAVFAPVRGTGLVDEISDRIVAAVDAGVLASGQRLPSETELAAALAVSPVTVRESLSRLRALGIIVTTRGRTGGSFIAAHAAAGRTHALTRLAGLTKVQLDGSEAHYQAIAVQAAWMAAGRAGGDDTVRLGALVRATSDTDTDWRLVETEFVVEVAAIARSAQLARELLRLQADLGAVTLLPNGDPDYRERTAGLRAAVVAAIESRRRAAAEGAMRELVITQFDALIEYRARL